MNEKHIELVRKNYKYLIALLCGIILIFLSSAGTGKTKNDVEKNLTKTLEMAEGVGEVDVMVTYNEKNVVLGVIIVADGAENPEVKKTLHDCAASTLDLPDHKVSVLAKKK